MSDYRITLKPAFLLPRVRNARRSYRKTGHFHGIKQQLLEALRLNINVIFNTAMMGDGKKVLLLI